MSLAGPAPRPGLLTMLKRGAGKRCPACGDGMLFAGWTRIRDRCPRCDTAWLDERGEPWAFLVLLDRTAFIFPLVVALYFRLHVVNGPLFLLLGVVLGATFLYATPNRYGVSVALAYWARMKFGGTAASAAGSR